jgi:hypothetical protein
MQNWALVIDRKIDDELGQIKWRVTANNGNVPLIRATVCQSVSVPLHYGHAFRELVRFAQNERD